MTGHLPGFEMPADWVRETSKGQGQECASAARTPESGDSSITHALERINASRGRIAALSRPPSPRARQVLQQILTQFRFVPHFEGGRITSYRPLDISPGSLLDQLGFANLDFIDAVNGIAVAAEGFDIADLLSTDEVLVLIRRDRQEILLRFSIVP